MRTKYTYPLYAKTHTREKNFLGPNLTNARISTFSLSNIFQVLLFKIVKF